MGIVTKNTSGTVDITAGSMCGRLGHHFDFGDHVEFISLMDQRKAFARILALLDANKNVQLHKCTLTAIYEDIQACQQNIIDEATSLLAKIKQD